MFSSSCAFADVDRDGDVDLFVVNYVDARVDNNIYCGDVARKFRIYCHPLTFTPLRKHAVPQQRQRGLHRRQQGSGHSSTIRGNGLGIVFGDYDDDGWPDAFVANDTSAEFPVSQRARPQL
jgi:hypothetical protein